MENKERKYCEPKTQCQKIISEIICEILKINRYGSNDSFIECGGNSINAIRVISALKKKGLSCSVYDLLTSHNLAELEQKVCKISEEEILTDRFCLYNNFELINDFLAKSISLSVKLPATISFSCSSIILRAFS